MCTPPSTRPPGNSPRQYPEISDAELNDLIGRSAAAYRSWRTTPLDQRRAVLTRAAEIHREQADELAKLLTLEMGKPIAQAKGEVAAGRLDLPVLRRPCGGVHVRRAPHHRGAGHRRRPHRADRPAGRGHAVELPLLPGGPLRGAEHRPGQHDHPQARAELPAVGPRRRTGPARGRAARRGLPQRVHLLGPGRRSRSPIHACRVFR